ncbi:hypothetical protein D3C84_1005270 [compost metagenome]
MLERPLEGLALDTKLMPPGKAEQLNLGAERFWSFASSARQKTVEEQLDRTP